MARALYSKARFLIWDDVFSAVDIDVGAEIFNNLFGEEGLLRKQGATVILATHSRKFTDIYCK